MKAVVLVVLEVGASVVRATVLRGLAMTVGSVTSCWGAPGTSGYVDISPTLALRCCLETCGRSFSSVGEIDSRGTPCWSLLHSVGGCGWARAPPPPPCVEKQAKTLSLKL